MKFRKLSIEFELDWKYDNKTPTIPYLSDIKETSIRTKNPNEMEMILRKGKRTYKGVIYCITQIKDLKGNVIEKKKSYIGKTTDFKVRWAKYKKDAFKNRRFDEFHKELRKYKDLKIEDYWSFTILEICFNATDLHNRELDWMKEYYGDPPDLTRGWNSKFGQ